jgi:hypothetical protein
MSVLTSYASASARDSAKPAASNTGLCIFRTDTKAIEVSDGANYLRYDYDSFSIASVSNSFSAEFDGTDDYISLGTLSGFNSASALSVGFWINLRDYAGSTVEVPFSSGTSTSNRVAFYLNSSSQLRWGIDGSVNNCILNLASPTDYRSTDAWHHVLGTYDGTTVTLYFDGSQVASTTNGVPSATQSTAGNNAAIGRSFASTQYFDGLLDNLAIWNASLDGEDASSLYNNGQPIDLTSNIGNYDKSASLTHWYRIGEGNDTVSGGGSPTSGGTIGTVENAENPGTNDGTGNGGATYSINKP